MNPSPRPVRLAQAAGPLLALALGLAGCGAPAHAQPPVPMPPQRTPPPELSRPPDFVLNSKKCVQVASRTDGRSPPLQIAHPRREREACWRSGNQVTCATGSSSINLRVNREAGPKLFLTAEGGLFMLSLDWTTGTFVNGITYYSDEVGIAHVQCAGSVQSGEEAARASGRLEGGAERPGRRNAGAALPR